MSSPQHLRSGSMFLMIATMICGVLAVLILLPAYDRVSGFKLPSKPSPQTTEALVATEKLSRVFSEFQGKATTRPRTLASHSDSTVISRAVHASQSAPQQEELRVEGRANPETPQVYVPVTVHPVTVNIDNGSLTAEVSRLNATMERLMVAPDQRATQTNGDAETQAEMLAIRQRLDEINAALAQLGNRESLQTPSNAEPASAVTPEPIFAESTFTEPATQQADEANNSADKFADVTAEFPQDNPFAVAEDTVEAAVRVEAAVTIETAEKPADELPSLRDFDEPAEQLEPQPFPEVTSESNVEQGSNAVQEADAEATEQSDDQGAGESIPELPMQVYEDSSLRTDTPLLTIPVSLPQHELPEASVPVLEVENTSIPSSPYPPAADMTVAPLEIQGEVIVTSPEPMYELPPLMTPEEELRYHRHSHQAPRKKSLFPQGFDYDLMDLPTPKLPKLGKLQFPKIPKPTIRGPRLPNWDALTYPDPDVPQWVDQLRDSDPLAPVRESQSVHRGLSALRFAGGSRTVD